MSISIDSDSDSDSDSTSKQLNYFNYTQIYTLLSHLELLYTKGINQAKEKLQSDFEMRVKMNVEAIEDQNLKPDQEIKNISDNHQNHQNSEKENDFKSQDFSFGNIPVKKEKIEEINNSVIKRKCLNCGSKKLSKRRNYCVKCAHANRQKEKEIKCKCKCNKPHAAKGYCMSCYFKKYKISYKCRCKSRPHARGYCLNCYNKYQRKK